MDTLNQQKLPEAHSGVQQIRPYVAGASKIAGKEETETVKISSNESPLGASPRASEAIINAASPEQLCRYPDGDSANLREALGKFYNIGMNNIICGNGSEQIISVIIRAFATEGDEVLYHQHGFPLYRTAALISGAIPVTAPEKDLRVDVDALISAVTEKTKIVLLANPNNPTGTYITKGELVYLRESLRSDILLVVDAAYAEFVDETDYAGGMDLVEKYQNVIVTRTFSKLYGLATLRLGWAYAPLPMIDTMNRAIEHFNVSSITQAAGLAALADTGHVEKVKVHNNQWLPWLSEKLDALGLLAAPSVANFLLLRFPQGVEQAKAADAFLKSKGVILRWAAMFGLSDCLRVTVGTESENKAFVAAIEEFMQQQ